MLLRHTAVALLLASVVGAQTVHVVDGGGGAAFTTIGDALLAADPGDVVLLRSGDYDEFPVINEGISLLADAGAVVTITSLSVIGIPSGETVRLRGFTITEGPGAFPGVLNVGSCDGDVVVEECAFLSAAVPFQSGGVRITNCNTVVISDSVIAAPDLSLTSVGASLTVLNASVWVFNSEITGRTGSTVSGPFGSPGDGDDAVQVSDAYLAIAGSTIRGGAGGAGVTTPFCTPGGDGGFGLGLDDGAVVYVADSIIEGGAGGVGLGTPGCEDGAPGAPTIIYGGTITTANPDALVRGLSTNSPTREGQTLTVSLTDLAAAPGDFAWIMFSTSPSSVAGSPSNTFTGLLALDSPTLIFLGALPATLTLDLSSVVPDLGPGFDLAQLDLQGLVLDASASSFVPTSPSSITLLDASF